LSKKKRLPKKDNLGNSKMETNKSDYGLQTFSLKISIRFATDQSQTGSRLKNITLPTYSYCEAIEYHFIVIISMILKAYFLLLLRYKVIKPYLKEQKKLL